MKTIKVKNGTQDALVDDDVYDKVSPHHWYYSHGIIYASMRFLTGKNVGLRSFQKKVRLDHFVYNYTTSINASVRHINGNAYDCQRDNLQFWIKDRGTPQYVRTMFLGVIQTPARNRNLYDDLFDYQQLSTERYERGKSIFVEASNDAKYLAQAYDRYVTNEKGTLDVRRNFLDPPQLTREELRKAQEE